MKKWVNKQTVVSFILGAILFITLPVFAESRDIKAFYNNIRLKVNGVFVKMDAEPFIINGRTMVPARFVAEPLGATVKFNETENCVEIVSNNEGMIRNKIQLFALDEYKALGDLSDKLKDFSNQIITIYFEHYLYKDEFNFDTINYDLKKLEKDYSAEVEYVNDMRVIAAIDCDKMDTVLSYHSEAIELYKNAFKRMQNFSVNNDFTEYDAFLADFFKAKEIIDTSYTLIDSEYEKLFQSLIE